MHFTETLLLAGLQPSIGTVADAYDNALAETTIGLYKTECTRDDSPFRDGPLETLADVEKITSEWVHWYNTSRLMHRLGRRPPAEAEAEYWAALGLTREPSRWPKSGNRGQARGRPIAQRAVWAILAGIVGEIIVPGVRSDLLVGYSR